MLQYIENIMVLRQRCERWNLTMKLEDQRGALGMSAYDVHTTSVRCLYDVRTMSVRCPVVCPWYVRGMFLLVHAEPTTHLRGAGTELVNAGRIKIHLHTPNEGPVGTARPVASFRTAGRW